MSCRWQKTKNYEYTEILIKQDRQQAGTDYIQLPSIQLHQRPNTSTKPAMQQGYS